METAIAGTDRTDEINLLSFPADSPERFLGENGNLAMGLGSVERDRLK